MEDPLENETLPDTALATKRKMEENDKNAQEGGFSLPQDIDLPAAVNYGDNLMIKVRADDSPNRDSK
jgi:hypothetical protein